MDVLVYRISFDKKIIRHFLSNYSLHGFACIGKYESSKFVTRDGKKGRIFYKENELSMMVLYN